MDPKYIIGVPEMDEQHEKILLLSARAKSATGDEFELNDLVLELINYAQTHLTDEENFLRKNGLTDFEKEHCKKHKLFRIEAMDFYDSFREASSLEEKQNLVQKVGEFCEKWLIEHIDGEDRVYAGLLKKR